MADNILEPMERSDVNNRVSKALGSGPGLAVIAGVSAAIALGALNQAAHPGAWAPRLLWAGTGLIAAVAAVLLAGRKERTAP